MMHGGGSVNAIKIYEHRRKKGTVMRSHCTITIVRRKKRGSCMGVNTVIQRSKQDESKRRESEV